MTARREFLAAVAAAAVMPDFGAAAEATDYSCVDLSDITWPSLSHGQCEVLEVQVYDDPGRIRGR